MNESFMDSAQRTESLISLSKPLGYTVAHRNCASATLSLNNTGTTAFRLIPYATTVSASKNGTNYNFVYINQLNDDDVTDDIIEPGQTKRSSFFSGIIYCYQRSYDSRLPESKIQYKQ